MKRLSSILICTIAGFISAGTGLAQSYAVKASVPFTFAVGHKWLPAGKYIISEISPEAIKVENAETGRWVALSLIQPESSAAVESGHLMFHKYGESYFLSEIACPAAAMTASLPTSSLERKAREREREAMNGSGEPGVVLVALNR